MSMRASVGTQRPAGNELLSNLPGSERDQILARSSAWNVDPEQPIQSPGLHTGRVFFPTTAVVSLLTVLSDGSTVETATIGREGMVGIHVFLGDDVSPNGAAVVQMGGQVLALDADIFRAELADSAKWQQSLMEYTRALMLQVSQGVACGVVHGVRQRLARWLLQTSDRVVSDDVSLTQQFLAEILHVRRASVTEAARSLEQAGAVRVRRGGILITDRALLEAASCECYAFLKEEYRRLMITP